MSEHTVQIGARAYEVQPFSPRKVFRATRLVGKLDRVQRKVSKEVAGYRKEYREENAEVVTRAMSGMPPWNQVLDKMSAADWDRVGGQVEVRRDPSDYETLLVLLGAAIDLAEEEVLRLLALVVIPNEELAEASRTPEGIDAALDRYSESFMDSAQIGQFVDLADVAIETLREEMMGKQQKVRRIRGRLTRGLLAPDLEEESETTDRQEGRSETKSPSSTPSPPPTTGPTQSASTEFPSASPAA